MVPTHRDPMPDTLCTGCNRVPDILYTAAFTGMNRKRHAHRPHLFKQLHKITHRVRGLISGKVGSTDSFPKEFGCCLNHREVFLLRQVTHCTDDHAILDTIFPASLLQSIQHRLNDLPVRQTLLMGKLGCKPHLDIADILLCTTANQVITGHPQPIPCLHTAKRQRKFFEILRQIPAIRRNHQF